MWHGAVHVAAPAVRHAPTQREDGHALQVLSAKPRGVLARGIISLHARRLAGVVALALRWWWWWRLLHGAAPDERRPRRRLDLARPLPSLEELLALLGEPRRELEPARRGCCVGGGAVVCELAVLPARAVASWMVPAGPRAARGGPRRSSANRLFGAC